MRLNPQEGLPVCKAHELDAQAPGRRWLIESLWARAAVGMVGGPPKCCKSWLGLDMALSVASATPCLGRFQVKAPGPALIYLAEDALADVRARIDSLCRHRSLDIARLDLSVITAPSMRLDLAQDQRRLDATLAAVRPRLLLLDPLVRLHRLDENSAGDVARLLGFLRQMQRRHQTAIALVHHTSKKRRSQPGQALRGSSDLHAFALCSVPVRLRGAPGTERSSQRRAGILCQGRCNQRRPWACNATTGGREIRLIRPTPTINPRALPRKVQTA